MNHLLSMMWSNEEEALRRVKMAEEAIKSNDHSEAKRQITALRRYLEESIKTVDAQSNVVVLSAHKDHAAKDKNKLKDAA